MAYFAKLELLMVNIMLNYSFMDYIVLNFTGNILVIVAK